MQKKASIETCHCLRSDLEVLCDKTVLKNLAKFTEKQLQWNPIFSSISDQSLQIN